MTGLAEDPPGIDYDAILRGNAERIFSEPDQARRLAALDELWTPDGELVDPDQVHIGAAAISASVDALLAMLPPGTRFAAQGAGAGHHGVGRLRWRAVGPDGTQGPVSGTDIALIRDGRIARLYVVLDSA